MGAEWKLLTQIFGSSIILIQRNWLIHPPLSFLILSSPNWIPSSQQPLPILLFVLLFFSPTEICHSCLHEHVWEIIYCYIGNRSGYTTRWRKWDPLPQNTLIAHVSQQQVGLYPFKTKGWQVQSPAIVLHRSWRFQWPHECYGCVTSRRYCFATQLPRLWFWHSVPISTVFSESWMSSSQPSYSLHFDQLSACINLQPISKEASLVKVENCIALWASTWSFRIQVETLSI